MRIREKTIDEIKRELLLEVEVLRRIESRLSTTRKAQRDLERYEAEERLWSQYLYCRDRLGRAIN